MEEDNDDYNLAHVQEGNRYKSRQYTRVYGAPDIKYLMDVLDSTHPTDRTQLQNIEGLDKITAAKWIIRKRSNSVYEAVETATGIVRYTDTNPDFVNLLDTLNNSTYFQDEDTIVIQPSSTPYLCGTGKAEATLNKSLPIYGYGATLQPNIDHIAAYFLVVNTAGKTLTVYGLTFDMNYPNIRYSGAIRRTGGVNIGGVKVWDCTIKNIYWFGINLNGIHPATPDTDTYLIVENCTFLNPGALSASGTSTYRKGSQNEMIGCNHCKFCSIRNCKIENNKLIYVSAQRVVIENVWGNKLGDYDATLVARDSICSEQCIIRNLHYFGDGIRIRVWASIHSLSVYGSNKQILMDDIKVEQNPAPAFWFEPISDTIRFENISIRKMYIENYGLLFGTQNKDTADSKFDLITIDDYVQSSVGANLTMFTFFNCDVGSLALNNVHFNGGTWNSNGNLITLQPSNVDMTLNKVEINNVVNPPPKYIFWVQGTSNNKAATITCRRPLDNGIAGTRLTGAGGTQMTQFVEN
jgi:hypothetical protein